MTPPVISAYFPSFPPILFPRKTADAADDKCGDADETDGGNDVYV